MRSLLLILVLLSWLLPSRVFGSAYDNCVLANIKGVTSDVAATAIKESCIRSTETVLPSTVITFVNAKAAYGQYYDGETGLFITLNNNSEYLITELTINIAENKSLAFENYVIRIFPPPYMISSMPDRSVLMILQPGVDRFFVPINQTTKRVNDFFKKYNWNIVAAKGIHS